MIEKKIMLEENKNRLLVLDSLRGLAAIMVVFFHYTMNREQANYGFRLGTTGVDLFFIISGFVIFLSLNKVSSSYEFVVNRLVRLYPTYWASVTFTFILIYLTHYFQNIVYDPINIEYYLWNLTMFQFFNKIPDLDGPYWTLSIELLFYFLMLILFKIKVLKYANYIGLVLAVFFTICAHFCKEFTYIRVFMVEYPLFQFIPLFFAGISFYDLYTKKQNRFFIYLSLIVYLICQILMYQYAGRSRNYISQTEYALMLSSFFILFFLFVNNKLGFIVSKYTIFLGKISFCLYLIHQYLGFNTIIPKMMDNFGLNFWIAAVLIALPITILIATLITFFIEIPLNKKLKSLLLKKKQ